MAEWCVTVLIFHHVSPDLDYYTNTPPAIFRSQIAALADEFEFLTVREAHRAFLSGEPADRRVVLTFDDGYKDNFLFALPVLKDFGIKATFFILPEFAGRMNEWNQKCGYRTPHLSWHEVDALLAEGHEIASHGLLHAPFTQLSLPEVERELRVSKKMIQERIGVPPSSFSFPYGMTNREVSGLAAAHYDVALSTVKSSETDWFKGRHALRRTYIPVDAEPPRILAIVNGEARL